MKFFENVTDKNRSSDAAALLDATFREFEVVKGKVPSPYISPSGLNCPMDMAFKLKGIPTEDKKESFQSRQFAEHGNDRHDRIQEFLSKTPYWVDVAEYVEEKGLPLIVGERKGHEVLLISEEYRTRFRCDGMLLIEGEYYVLEIKTERGSVTKRRTGPDEKHYLQGLAYTMLLDVDRIMWVYEGREFLKQKPFVQEVTQKEKEYIKDYIKNIIDNVDTPENLPYDPKACRYSSYKKYRKMYLAEIKRKEMEEIWKKEQNIPKK